MNRGKFLALGTLEISQHPLHCYLKFFATCANHSMKHLLTTKITKVTKDLNKIFEAKLRVLHVLRGVICGSVPNFSSARFAILDPPSSIFGLYFGCGFAALRSWRPWRDPHPIPLPVAGEGEGEGIFGKG
jgi:hypothetical protein